MQLKFMQSFYFIQCHSNCSSITPGVTFLCFRRLALTAKDYFSFSNTNVFLMFHDFELWLTTNFSYTGWARNVDIMFFFVFIYTNSYKDFCFVYQLAIVCVFVNTSFFIQNLGL